MRRAALVTFLGAATAFSAAPAFADSPPPVPAPTPPPAPAPAPAPQSGRLRLEVVNGVAAHHRKYVLTGDNVSVVGHVKPYVAGQTVRVRISTSHRKPTLVHTKIRKSGGEGTFKI